MFLCSKRLRKLSFCGLFLALICLLSLSFAGEATAKSKSSGKRKTRARPVAARVTSVPAASGRYADIVIEADTGRVLRATNEDEIRHPASLTKMMTLYLAFQALESGAIQLETPLTVSSNAAQQSPTKLGVRAGQRLRAYDAIMGLVTESANDAAVVLAENLGGSVAGFADMMNRQARALGMRQTVFYNPSGLPDPRQVTTAKDMVLLGYALIAHYPGFYPYFSRQNFEYAGREYQNHNRLMRRYEGMDGIKTGYIRASGFNLVASATRNNKRLIGAVFGGSSAVKRDNQMAQILDEAFMAERPGASELRQAAYVQLPSKSAEAFSSRRARASAPQHMGSFSETLPDYTGGWSIQIGAFSDVDSASEALRGLMRTMHSVLEQAEPVLQKVTMTDGSAMYRARFVGLNQTAARSACSHLIRRGQGCLVVSGP